MNIITIIIIFISYFFSSISSAILICRLAHLPDPRTVGSKNPGTTNIFRINSKLAISVMIFDIFKGMMPVLIGRIMHVSSLWLCVIAISACLGHIYPVFFKFRGGKGMATALGALMPINSELSIIMIITWIITVLLSGYSSLGSIFSILIAPAYIYLFEPHLIIQIGVISCLILLRHRNNIKHLWQGKERKFWHG